MKKPLNPCATAIEPALESPGTATSINTCITGTEAPASEAPVLQREKPPQQEACTSQLEKSIHSNEDPAQPLNKLIDF